MPSSSAPKPKLRGTSREHIVEVSRAIIEDEGASQLTIRRIAEAVHRTQPAVYQHFAGKEAILAAVVVEGFEALIERLGRASNDGLAAIAEAYVRFGLERPRLYDVMFVTPPVVTFAGGDATPKPARTAFAIFATAVAAGGLERARVDTVTEIVWASLHGLVMLSITERLRPGRALHRARLERLVTVLVAMTEPVRAAGGA